MPIFSRVPLRSAEIVTRTIREIDDDNCLGLAAQLAFYFFLSLFPALLFLVARGLPRRASGRNRWKESGA